MTNINQNFNATQLELELLARLSTPQGAPSAAPLSGDSGRNLLANTLLKMNLAMPQGPQSGYGPAPAGISGYALALNRRAQISQALGPDSAPAATALDSANTRQTAPIGPADTLNDLAVQYGVSVSDIIRANPGKEAQLRAIQNATPYNPSIDVNNTMRGQRLNIPQPGIMDRMTFKSDRELNSMEEEARRLAGPGNGQQSGPGATWTQQQRLNFARARMEMQDGDDLKSVLGEQGLPTFATHVLGDNAAEAMGLEIAGGGLFIGLGAHAAGDVMIDSLKNTLNGATDYQLARDVDYLHQLVEQYGDRALDANTLVNDPHFTGAEGLTAGVTPEQHVAAALALYQATFGHR